MVYGQMVSNPRAKPTDTCNNIIDHYDKQPLYDTVRKYRTEFKRTLNAYGFGIFGLSENYGITQSGLKSYFISIYDDVKADEKDWILINLV